MPLLRPSTSDFDRGHPRLGPRASADSLALTATIRGLSLTLIEGKLRLKLRELFALNRICFKWQGLIYTMLLTKHCSDLDHWHCCHALLCYFIRAQHSALGVLQLYMCPCTRLLLSVERTLRFIPFRL